MFGNNLARKQSPKEKKKEYLKLRFDILTHMSVTQIYPTFYFDMGAKS